MPVGTQFRRNLYGYHDSEISCRGVKIIALHDHCTLIPVVGPDDGFLSFVCC